MKSFDELREGYVSMAQQRAVWATRKDGGKGHPDNKKKSKKEDADSDAVKAFLAKGGKIKKLPPGKAQGYHGKSDPGAGIKGMLDKPDSSKMKNRGKHLDTSTPVHKEGKEEDLKATIDRHQKAHDHHQQMGKEADSRADTVKHMNSQMAHAKALRVAKERLARMRNEYVSYHGNPNKDDEKRNAERRKRLAKGKSNSYTGDNFYAKPKSTNEGKAYGPTGVSYYVPSGHKDEVNPKTGEKYPERQKPGYKSPKEAYNEPQGQAKRMMSPLQKIRMDKEKKDRDKDGKLKSTALKKTNEVLDSPVGMKSYKDKAQYSKDSAKNSAVANILRGTSPDKDKKTVKKREKGLSLVRNKAIKAIRKESTLSEMTFKVEIDGLPAMYIEGPGPGAIAAKLRKIVKQPSMIGEIERVTPADMKKHFRDLSQGRGEEENED